MPEPDALSPERLLAQAQVEDRMLAEALRALPTHDAQLAKAVAAAPAVLVVAGTAEPTRQTLRAAPVTVHGMAPPSSDATAPRLALPEYPGAVTSIDELDSQAGGWGLISAESSRGVIRRMPTVASIDGTLLPSLAVEMLRVAQRAPSLRLAVSGSEVRSVTVGRLNVPTEADGAVRVYFSPHLAQRFVSAVDVLDGQVRESELRGQLVLIGLTGVALQEYQNTPIGQRMSGSEIQAQLMENLLDGTLLQRPAWAPLLEAGVLLVLGALLLWAVPRWRTYPAALLLLACVVLPVLLAFGAFRWHQLLFDALTPSLSLLLFFGVLLLLTLAESTQHERALQRLVQAQREDGARLSGELQAAQQVQTANLPRPETLHGDPRVELHTTLQPAREVGGDLYDFFMLDERRLFLLIGDVAGKGLSASIFMAVSKALYKSAMLRTPEADIGAIMAVANARGVARQPGQPVRHLLRRHPRPGQRRAALLQRRPRQPLPAACRLRRAAAHRRRRRPAAVRDARFRLPRRPHPVAARRAAVPDDRRRDRGADARWPALRQPAAAAPAAGAAAPRRTAREVVEALRADVSAFAAGAEPADDLTILALRWNGPAGAAGVNAASAPGSRRAGCAPRPRRRRWARSARACRGRRRRCSRRRCLAPPARGAPPRPAAATARR